MEKHKGQFLSRKGSVTNETNYQALLPAGLKRKGSVTNETHYQALLPAGLTGSALPV